MGGYKRQIDDFEKAQTFRELFSTGQLVLYWILVFALQLLVATILLSRLGHSDLSLPDLISVDDPAIVVLVVGMGLIYTIQFGTAIVLILPRALASRTSRAERRGSRHSTAPSIRKRWIYISGLMFFLGPLTFGGIIWLLLFIESVFSAAALLIAVSSFLSSLDQKHTLGVVTKTRRQWYFARVGGVALVLLSVVVFSSKGSLPVAGTREMVVAFVYAAYTFALLDTIIGMPIVTYKGVIQSKRNSPVDSKIQQRAEEIEQELVSTETSRRSRE